MNIPSTALDNATNILLIGLGGGFDVFTGLPIVFSLPDKNFVLVNAAGPSPTYHFRKSTPEDYPEGQLPEIENISAVYTIGRHGPIAVRKALEKIIEENNIDTILGIDGGVDSLARGDEAENGTVLEDFITLAALKGIDLPMVHCCAGFGCETEENMNHYRILENIAFLSNSLLGTCSLTNGPVFERYKHVCEAVWNGSRKSHIQTKIISAVLGRFGDNNLYFDIDAKVINSTGLTFISPLSSIYWFFDMKGIIAANLFVERMKVGNTFADAKIIFKQVNSGMDKRFKKIIPL